MAWRRKAKEFKERLVGRVQSLGHAMSQLNIWIKSIFLIWMRQHRQESLECQPDFHDVTKGRPKYLFEESFDNNKSRENTQKVVLINYLITFHDVA